MHPGEKSRCTEFGTMCAEMAENYRAEMNAALDVWAADGFRFGKSYDSLVRCAEYLPMQARIIAQATETEARHGRL